MRLLKSPGRKGLARAPRPGYVPHHATSEAKTLSTDTGDAVRIPNCALHDASAPACRGFRESAITTPLPLQASEPCAVPPLTAPGPPVGRGAPAPCRLGALSAGGGTGRQIFPGPNSPSATGVATPVRNMVRTGCTWRPPRTMIALSGRRRAEFDGILRRSLCLRMVGAGMNAEPGRHREALVAARHLVPARPAPLPRTADNNHYVKSRRKFRTGARRAGQAAPLLFLAVTTK